MGPVRRDSEETTQASHWGGAFHGVIYGKTSRGKLCQSRRSGEGYYQRTNVDRNDFWSKKTAESNSAERRYFISRMRI